jgi:hypothetical protein
MRNSAKILSTYAVWLAALLALAALPACKSDDSVRPDATTDASADSGDTTAADVDEGDASDTDPIDASDSTDSSDTTDPPPVPACDVTPESMSDVELYEQLIRAWCERFIDCRGANDGYTMDVCMDTLDNRLAWHRHRFEQGALQLDRDAARQCLASSCELACHDLDAPCHLDTLDGTVELGESCRVNGTCKQGVCNYSVENNNLVQCSGTCTLSDVGCGGQTCRPNEYCHDDECRERLDEGSTCDPFVIGMCLHDLSCGPEDICITPREEGGACLRIEDCAEGLVCRQAECKQPSQLGERCGSNQHCDTGLYCGDAGECVERAPAGSTCFGDEQCLEDHRCHPLDCDPLSEYCPDDLEGTCVGDASAGEYCLYSDDCDDGLFCSPQETCEQTYDDGERCSIHGDVDQCAKGAVCAGGLCNPEPNFTEPLPERDEPCVPLQIRASTCADGLFCTIDDDAPELAYTCQDAKPVGGTCHRDVECASGRCARDPSVAVGECLALLELGDSCGHPADCASGICIDRTCVDSKRQLGQSCNRDADCGEGVCHGGRCTEPQNVCTEWQ